MYSVCACSWRYTDYRMANCSNVSSLVQYGCQGSSSDPNDMVGAANRHAHCFHCTTCHPCVFLVPILQSCGFRVTDYLCLFLMILEVVLLALVLCQVRCLCHHSMSLSAMLLVQRMFPPSLVVAVYVCTVLSCIRCRL